MSDYRVGICAIAKDEGRYLLEWLAYHKAMGFDRVFLYDNDSSDDTAKLLGAPGVRDFAVRIPWSRSDHERPQFEAYKHWLGHYRHEVDWVAVLDLDEFLNLHVHDTIEELLRSLGDVGEVGFNWRMFGDGGERHYRPGFVTERFTRASARDYRHNHTIKSIARCVDIERLLIHAHAMRAGARFVSPSGIPLHAQQGHQDQVDHSVAQLNHYFTKSWQEWEIKCARGKADLSINHPKRFRDLNSFVAYNRNEEDDRSILRFADAARRIVEEWALASSTTAGRND